MSHNSDSVNQYTRFSQNAYENEQTNNKCFHFYTVYWSPHFNKEIISLFCIFNHIIGSISIWLIYNEMNNSIIQMEFIFTKSKVLHIRYQCVGQCLLFPSPPIIWVVLLLDLSCGNMPHLLTYSTMSTCFIPIYCRPTTTMSTRFMLTCFHLRFLICRALLAGRGVLVLFSGGRVFSLLGSENVNLL